MVKVSHLIGPSALPAPPQGIDSYQQLSVISYNVLLPNSQDAWWTYKMYSASLNKDMEHISSWKYRQKLLRNRIELVNADIVCLQEVAPDSFESDFDFMTELGYEGREMFKRGRFRPATFWKTTRCTLVSPPVHKDRTLLTAFRLTTGQPSNDERNWFVLNCHLQAGKEGARRVRQINDGIKSVMTLARKLKEADPAEGVRLIVCGDFNGGPECGAVRYCEDGAVDETFREDGDPVTSSCKELPLSQPLIDTVASLERSPPPTMVVPELIEQMIKPGTADTPELSDELHHRLKRIYKRRSNDHDTMSVPEVEAWLVEINGMVGRGSEFRCAARKMGYKDPENKEELSNSELKKRMKLPEDGELDLSGFLDVYREELRAGKFWGIAYDLAVLGEPLPNIGLFQGRYDRMYHSCALQPVAVLDTLCTEPCPNEFEPSDHLPVAATFTTASPDLN